MNVKNVADAFARKNAEKLWKQGWEIADDSVQVDHHIQLVPERICSNKLDMYKSWFKLEVSENALFVGIMLWMFRPRSSKETIDSAAENC